MLTVNIDDPVIERHIRSIAISHSRAVDDIVIGAIAAQLGFPDMYYAGNMQLDDFEHMYGCKG